VVGEARLVLQRDFELADSFGVRGVPAAVVLGPDGGISARAAGEDAVRGLLLNLGFPRQPGDFPEVVEQLDDLPDVPIWDREGRLLSLHDVEGHDQLLLFWSPTCAACQGFLERVGELLLAGVPRPLRLILVTGHDILLPIVPDSIVLDKQFRIGRAFGVAGTPAGVLIRYGAPALRGAGWDAVRAMIYGGIGTYAHKASFEERIYATAN
jgi:hypothetical protein